MASVLVVDDDPDIRELVEFKLRQMDLDVRTAADGEQALAEVRCAVPDLVVLDVMMPRLSGIEVCRQLRQERGTSQVGVILLTARAQEAEIERGFAAGADDYIVKPFSPRELAVRVRALLARAA